LTWDIHQRQRDSYPDVDDWIPKMRLIQYDRQGSRGVGRLEDETFLVPLRMQDGMSPDELIIAIAMGDIATEPTQDPIAITSVSLAQPIRHPASIRDFMLFEDHLANTLGAHGRSIPPAWYSAPSFYFTCPHTVLVPGAELIPPKSDQLDYELELAVVIGRRLHNPSRQEALEAIAGFTLFNDFSLRDVQASERPVGLGPSKSKDFASALGPNLVTTADIPGDISRPDLTLSASVNGEEWSEASATSMHFDLAEAIMHAAKDSVVVPGDVIATGTLPSGCILELMAVGDEDQFHWLQPGDEVVLRADHLGSLKTRVGTPMSDPANAGHDIQRKDRRDGLWGKWGACRIGEIGAIDMFEVYRWVLVGARQ
jgi:2-keto-4-pentenoate hydratase/2-oxohepta-3-ene-1,7-dioic acid hydratase in catechol pathway